MVMLCSAGAFGPADQDKHPRMAMLCSTGAWFPNKSRCSVQVGSSGWPCSVAVALGFRTQFRMAVLCSNGAVVLGYYISVALVARWWPTRRRSHGCWAVHRGRKRV